MQEQILNEAHCEALLKKYLAFRGNILQLNDLVEDRNHRRELILNQFGEPASPGEIIIITIRSFYLLLLGKVFLQVTGKVFGKELSYGTFRKIFETGASEANLTEAERKVYSEHSLHSKQVAEDYYAGKNVGRTVLPSSPLSIFTFVS